jgi:hypothetical protein
MNNDNRLRNNRLRNVIASVAVPSGYVLVSTVFAGDWSGWETMVFECHESGDVVSWQEIDCRRHNNLAEAVSNHSEFMREWRSKE